MRIFNNNGDTSANKTGINAQEIHIQIESMDDLLARIASMTTTDESNQVHDTITTYKGQMTADEYQRVRQALSVRLNLLADQFEAELKATDDQMKVGDNTIH